MAPTPSVVPVATVATGPTSIQAPGERVAAGEAQGRAAKAAQEMAHRTGRTDQRGVQVFLVTPAKPE
jgi:hypothetical protein